MTTIPAFAEEKEERYDNKYVEAYEKYQKKTSENYEEVILQKIKQDENLKKSVLSGKFDSTKQAFVEVSYKLDDELLLEDSGNELVASTTVTAIIPTESINAAFTESQSTSSNDPTVSVNCFSTIYWYRDVIGGLNYYKLYRVSGGYRLLDSSVSVLSQSVLYGQSGGGLYPEFDSNHTGTYYPAALTTSWSKNTGFQNFTMIAAGGLINCVYTIKLKRNNGSSTWTYVMENRKYN